MNINKFIQKRTNDFKIRTNEVQLESSTIQKWVGALVKYMRITELVLLKNIS